VNDRYLRSNDAFSLVELLIGMSLALMVMGAVLSSYTFMGRNLFKLVNQQTLQTEARRTLQYLEQDVNLASGISGTPSASSLVLIIPTNSTGSTTTITWSYNSTSGTLTRTPASGVAQTLLSNLTSCVFTYYDRTGNSYTSATLSAGSYLSSIKQVALSFTSRTGLNANGSNAPQMAAYQATSARLTLRNQGFLQ
jgi:Tfp pilus assembly protein PilW